MSRLRTVAVALLAWWAAAEPAAALTIQLDPRGLASVQHDGWEWVEYHSGAYRGQFQSSVTLQRPDGATYSVSATATNMDYGTQTLTFTYPWGAVRCRYEVVGDALRFHLSVTNAHATDAVTQFQFQLIHLAFPNNQTPVGWNNNDPPKSDNYMQPTVLVGDYSSGRLALVNEEVTTPLSVRFASRYWNGYPVTVRSIGLSLAPGGAVAHTVALRWAAAGTPVEELAGDIYAAFAGAFPYRLNWPDRRAIGMLFLASSAAIHKSATNPRGWLNDPTIDVFSEAGRAAFHNRIRSYAHNSVKILTNMNAQGMITWDLEGEEFASTTYVGDPRLLAVFAPEMDEIADEYFAIFRNAGLRVGVTLRGQEVVFRPDGTAYQRTLSDPVAILAMMDAKLQYARQRWGCTLFYIDTNVTTNNFHDAGIYEELLRRYPDVLIMPEFSKTRYYASTAPYGELDLGKVSTPASALRVYPQAFSVINPMDGNIDSNRTALVQSVRRGDILLFHGWWGNPTNAKIKDIYRDAALPFEVLRCWGDGADLWLRWTAAGNVRYRLQAAPRLTRRFADISDPIMLTGNGAVTNEAVVLGALTNGAAQFYRWRFAP